jgi:hypothetical protein
MDQRAPPFSELTGDEAILNFIFSPGGGPGAIYAAPAPRMDGVLVSESDERDLERELSAVRAAEAGRLEEALSILDALCANQRASAFNNRWACAATRLGEVAILIFPRTTSTERKYINSWDDRLIKELTLTTL